MAEERQFKGVWIPKEIWLDTRLNALEKVILTEIDSLDAEESGCYASNKYLSEFCQCSETKVSTAISKLIELEYLYVKSFDGRTRVLKSRLSKNERQTLKILKTDLKKVKDNNIDNNNIDNNIYIMVLDYLNDKAGTHFKSVDCHIKLIKARLKSYSLEQIKGVIDMKVKEWKGTSMQQYLRPKTLFCETNFENYVNCLPAHISTAKITEKSYSKEELNNLFSNLEDIEI